MTAKKRKSLSLLIVLAAILVVGVTYAYFTDAEEVTNVFTVGDLEIDLEEPSWTPEQGEEVPPGRVIEKDPTVEAVKGDSYMRMIVSYIDMTGSDVSTDPDYNKDYGAVITDPARIALIEKTIYHDIDGVLTTSGKYYLDTLGLSGMINLNNLLTANSVDQTFNKEDFTKDAARSSAGINYYNYNTVLAKGDKATIFTHIIVPSEWNQDELKILGSYGIVIKAEAIQVEGFANAAEAYTALDAQLVFDENK